MKVVVMLVVVIVGSDASRDAGSEMGGWYR